MNRALLTLAAAVIALTATEAMAGRMNGSGGINGASLNGLSLNGLSINGIAFNGAAKAGTVAAPLAGRPSGDGPPLGMNGAELKGRAVAVCDPKASIICEDGMQVLSVKLPAQAAPARMGGPTNGSAGSNGTAATGLARHETPTGNNGVSLSGLDRHDTPQGNNGVSLTGLAAY